MIDRLVCADGGNPDPTTTGFKNPVLAKELELKRAGCQAVFDQLSAQAWTSPMRRSVHNLVVDTYAMQHPEGYGKSPKSYGALDRVARRWRDAVVDHTRRKAAR